VSQQVAGVSLADVQRPVAEELEHVVAELRRVIAADFPIVSEVNEHLLHMKGKLFRPTLLLLSNKASGGGANDARAITLGAVVELIHLATLVHDDSVDHSVLRRGLPTINALFSHQIAVIMGDYLYSRAIIELVRLDAHEALRVLARVTNEMTVGEMRQLEAHDKLAYGEGAYDALIRAKTASLLSGACEVGALTAPPAYRQALARFGMLLGMAFQITDDLLDYTQTEVVTGKPSGLALREHKVTLPLIAALNRMPADGPGRRVVAALMEAAEPSDDLVAEVIRQVEAAGGLEVARQRALELAQQAEAELDVPRLTGAGRLAGEHCVRRRDAELTMPGPRRPGFYVGVLAVGFVVGGLLHAFLRRFLPQGPAREVFTWSVTPTIGPIHMDLLVMSITLGPIGLDVSLLAVVGVAVAFLVARSLF
jgi:octaprenyl-diphosphate synthase